MGLETSEQERLSEIYEQLRLKLLDLTKRNRMLNYTFGARSRRQLQFVDVALKDLYLNLVEQEQSLRISYLNEPDNIPADEKTPDFQENLEIKKNSDQIYLEEIDGKEDEAELQKAENSLRDRLRAELGMQPRPKRSEINRNQEAQKQGVNPCLDLELTSKEEKKSKTTISTLKFQNELEANLGKIADESRLTEQEAGISTLYLAFGFLEWFESENSDKSLYAPLLMLPVRLTTDVVKGVKQYSLSARDGTAETNVSLENKLERDFKRTLPSFFVDDDEEKTLSIDEYFQKVIDSVTNLKRWRIRNWVVLGNFSFSRIAMFNDTKLDKWTINPLTSGLVSDLLKGYEDDQDNNTLTPLIPDDYRIDIPEIEQIAPVLIHDADASQHSALVDVMKAKNLVMQGPPGTGKSQTITNIIANTLYDGKTVLFLSEKQAALEVVKRRLDTAGLGHFCLELHSEKSDPKNVIKSLAERYEINFQTGNKTITPQIDHTWAKARREINEYLEALHTEQIIGTTPFKLIWKSIYSKSSKLFDDKLINSIVIPIELLNNDQKTQEAAGLLEIYSRTAQDYFVEYGQINNSPWNYNTPTNVAIYECNDLIQALDEILLVSKNWKNLFAENLHLGLITEPDFIQVCEAHRVLPNPPEIIEIEQINAIDLADLITGLELKKTYLDAEEDLIRLPEDPAICQDTLDSAYKIFEKIKGSGKEYLAPSELYAEISETIDSINEFLSQEESFRKLLKIIGFNDDFPCKGLETLSIAVKKIPKIDHQALSFLIRTGFSEQDFFLIYDKWKPIYLENKDLKILFLNYKSEKWPEIELIEATIETIQKTGLAKFINSFNKKTKVAEKILANLGISISDEHLANKLKRLANHIKKLAEFENNQIYKSKLGGYWKGINTPFPGLKIGFQLREAIKKEIAHLPHSENVFNGIISLSDHNFKELISNAELAENYLIKLPVFSHLIDSIPLSETLKIFNEKRNNNIELLNYDKNKELSGIKQNIATLAKINEATKKRDNTLRALENNNYAHLISRIAFNKDRIEAIKLNINWIKAVKNTKLNDPLINYLMSINADDWRNKIQSIANKYITMKQDLEETKRKIIKFGIKNLDNIYTEKQIQRIKELISAGESLAPFLTLNKQIDELSNIGLGDFLEKSQNSAVEPKIFPDLFKSIITTARAKYYRKSLEPLSNNNGSTLDALRKTFSERDRLKIKQDRQIIREKLLKRSPPIGVKYGPVKNWTETYLLKHEFDKQRGYVPVRRLLQRAGNSIISLKPCFMMSPMSASKFLSNNQNQFDLLVIDEASQMRPEDALGAMLRSKQIIVVGDPKQLPPTNFFDRSDDQIITDDESDNIDDESILERCQKVFNNVRRLKWHYRSKCESLIRFSNAEFYENSLITFPAASPNSFSIDLIRVNGEYKAKVNLDEAERVSEEAIAFMHHHADFEIHQTPTIGIVTTNIPQKDLIADIFRRMSSGDELVISYMEKVEERGEPFFIKNLENVQGDERDFIFISLNYGFEKGANVLTQRFGPINTKQGHRRLNVLFSRARSRIALFSSFGSDDVTPSDTSRQGVHTLKRYLQYAETQGLAGLEDSGGVADSEFELEVARRLVGAGFQIELQVGVSGYKIDIGVKHPKFPEKFLAGVECDGASYHSSKSARDRDRIREEILNQLGWDLLRIWSTDWFDNPDIQTNKLVNRLNELASRPIKSNNIYNLSTRHYIKKLTSQNKSTAEQNISTGQTEAEPRQKSLLDLFTRTKG